MLFLFFQRPIKQGKHTPKEKKVQTSKTKRLTNINLSVLDHSDRMQNT
jgi:hypothetical protein